MEEENELVAQRRQKLAALGERGVAAFGSAFDTDGNIADVPREVC
jgi:hypothetical protein